MNDFGLMHFKPFVFFFFSTEVAKDGRKMCTALMVENAWACYKALQTADSSIVVLKKKN